MTEEYYQDGIKLPMKDDELDISQKYRTLVDYLLIILADMPADKVCDSVFMGIEKKLQQLGELSDSSL